MSESELLLQRAERGTRRGADVVWAAAQRRHRPHSLLVGAALVLFVVVAVAALSFALGHAGDSTPTATTPPSDTTKVTATAGSDELESSVTVTGPELGQGSTVTARATLTNVSSEPLTVNVDPEDLMRIRWEVMPARLLEPAHDLGITSMDAGAVYFRSPGQPASLRTPEELMAPPPSVTLAPGESTSFEAVVDIDDQVRTGPVSFLFTPRLVVAPPPEAAPGTTTFRQPPDASLEVPLTVRPAADGTLTEADAAVLALEDPIVEQWFHSSPGGWPGGTLPGTMNFAGTFPTSDGWQVIIGIQSEDATGEPADLVRELGLCGFIVDVDRQGTVTIEYMIKGDGS